jgi:hypothetical protein
VKHVIKGILLNGGLFNSAPHSKINPQRNFEEILESALWLGSVSRPPTKVCTYSC